LNSPLAVQHHTPAPEGPAHVGDADKERGRQAVEAADLAGAEGQPAAETHRADAEAVGGGHHARLHFGQLRHRIDISGRAQELLFGEGIASSAVTSDADAEEARPAAVSLGRLHCLHDAGIGPFEIAVVAHTVEGGGQHELRAGVFAAAPLEDEANIDILPGPLLEMDDRGARSKVGAAVPAGQAVDRILAQVAARGRRGDRSFNGATQLHLVDAHRSMNVKSDRAGVLADRGRALAGEADIEGHHVEREAGAGVRLLTAARFGQDQLDIARQKGRGTADQFEKIFFQFLLIHRASWCGVAAAFYSFNHFSAGIIQGRARRSGKAPPRA